MAESTQQLPSPPFIPVDGVANFRALHGARIRPNLVFRSADPTRATPAGRSTMSKELGIKVIFDLRSTPEIQRDGPEWNGVSVSPTDVFEPYHITREWVPVFSEKDYGPDQVAVRYKDYVFHGTEGFVRAYTDILRNGGPAYRKILLHLAAEAGPSPCLIHCTAGKDRTGILVALLWLLLGADRDFIATEYALTDLGLAHLKPLFIERLLKNPALQGNTEGVQRMVSSRKENMEASIEMIYREFGGERAYMRKYCGLSDDEIERLRKNLIHNLD